MGWFSVTPVGSKFKGFRYARKNDSGKVILFDGQRSWVIVEPALAKSALKLGNRLPQAECDKVQDRYSFELHR